jgi:hypothetical protein
MLTDFILIFYFVLCSMDEVQQVREIRVLKQLNGHPNIIFLREIIL